jgi:GT2 family glycosyltransferase
VNSTTKPRITFVIPVLNGERDISRCLQSIRNLDVAHENYEIVIVDNGSTDRTHQIIRELGCNFQIEPAATVGGLRNRGAALARGEYIAFVDSDVELGPKWFHDALASFKDHNVVATGCFPRVPDDSTWVQRTWDIHQRGGDSKSGVRAVPWLPSMNLVVRREAFRSIGGFNEKLETAEDVDLCYRLGHRGMVVSNTGMVAIHWGEARDLRTFWRKEVWRGKSNLQGILSHGLRWDELPSVGYPLYMLSVLILLCLTLLLGFGNGYMILMIIALLPLPALLLALRVSYRLKQLRALPSLFLLYLIYGVARAYSVSRSTLTSPSRTVARL